MRVKTKGWRLAPGALAAAALLGLAGPALAGSGQYVNMGSSYAAGPGVGERDPGSPTACARSADNYAHLLADWRGLDLTDVSCSGATTHDILAPSNGLPAQVDAVTPSTQLVTVLVGGNDVGYLSTLLGLSCQDKPSGAGAPPRCTVPSEQSASDSLAKLPSSLAAIFAAIRQRAPRAQIVLVDYLRAVPRSGSCPDRAPLTAADQQRVLALHARLTEVMTQAAGANGVRLLPAAALSIGHEVCSARPWVFDFTPAASRQDFPHDPYHPDGRGMAVVAMALDRMLFPN